MGRLSLLLSLLCAATYCVNANPFSKIPDNIHYRDGFISKRSSSSSQTSSYSHSNEDKIEIGGIKNGQAFKGSKTSAYSQNGGSHSESSSYSSASASGAIPIAVISSPVAESSQLSYGALHNSGAGFANQQDSTSGQFHRYGSSTTGNEAGQQAGSQTAPSTQFWWMGPNNPFLNGQKLSGGCTPNGCVATTTFETNIRKVIGGTYAGNGADRTKININGNPFLYGSGASSKYGGSSVGANSNYGGSSIGTSSNYGGSLVGANSNYEGSSLGTSSNYGDSSVDANSKYGGSSVDSSSNYGGSSVSTSSDYDGSSVGTNSNFGDSSIGGSSLGSASSGSSLFASNGVAGSSNILHGTTMDVSKNPFLNGVGIIAGSSSGGFESADSSADTQTNLVGESNSIFNTGSSGTSFGQVPQIPSVSTGSANPFFKPQVPQVPQTPQFPKYPQQTQVPQILQVPQDQENNYDEQQVAGLTNYPLTTADQQPEQDTNNDNNEFRVTCSGEGRICVQYYLCSVDGYVTNKDLTQVRSGPQVCDLNTEVCCTLKASDQKSSSSVNGGIFGNGNINQQQTDLTVDGIIYPSSLPGISNDQPENNGYLPPIGSAPSDNVPAFTNPPKDEESDKSGGSSSPVASNIFPPAEVPPPQIGCAAALICVEEQFCSLEGVITTEPVSFTSQQLIRRVPLSSCQNPDNGVIGKCCRDPNYVDPWPTGNLPANYSGGFDEQGFPTILNIAKIRPTKKQSYNGGAVKSPRPVIKTSFSAPNRQQINPASQFPTKFPQPEIPQAPYNEAVKYPTPFVLPNSQNQYIKNVYDASSSNQSPTIIAPHIPGSHCGVRNKVQRPNGLSDVDVGFGEIPWQAMVLSNTKRKLLCSGAIVAPNAVVTAASCVDGFSPSEISIKSGEWKLGYELKNEEPLPYEIINVVSVESYPAFSSGNPANDIAILFLEHDMKLDQHVDLLCLPEGPIKPPQPGRKCIATGWGKTVLQVNVAGSLMHGIDIDVLDNELCLQRIFGAETQIPLDDSLFCAKAHKQNNNMCQVDFGGPLACDRGDGYYELAGIYNQDTGCLPTNQVATFAAIPSRWIQEMMTNPLKYSNKDYQSPVGQSQFVHTRGPNEPCNCQDRELKSSATSQYLPPV